MFLFAFSKIPRIHKMLLHFFINGLTWFYILHNIWQVNWKAKEEYPWLFTPILSTMALIKNMCLIKIIKALLFNPVVRNHFTFKYPFMYTETQLCFICHGIEQIRNVQVLLPRLALLREIQPYFWIVIWIRKKLIKNILL